MQRTPRPVILILAITALLIANPSISLAEMVDIEDVGAGLPSESFWNGSDKSGVPDGSGSQWIGGFLSGPSTAQVYFNNVYGESPPYTYWNGWAYSNTTDTVTSGFINQYSAVSPAGGGDNSATYGVATAFSQGEATIDLPADFDPVSARFTNTTYAYNAIRYGDDGGFNAVTEFDTGDTFLLEVFGYDADDALVDTVPFYLADYRGYTGGDDSSMVTGDWTTLDLTSLAGSQRLEFSLTSTDMGPFGMNTPAYFAMDNLMLTPASTDPGGTGVPEPTSLSLALLGLLLLAWRRSR